MVRIRRNQQIKAEFYNKGFTAHAPKTNKTVATEKQVSFFVWLTSEFAEIVLFDSSGVLV